MSYGIDLRVHTGHTRKERSLPVAPDIDAGGILGTDTICAYRRVRTCATGLSADSAGAGQA